MSRYYDECEDRYIDDLLQPQTDLERSRDYLRSRVEQIACEFRDVQYKAFGLEDDAPPTTAAELVKRIQDGKFVLEDSTKDKAYYSYASACITWRDPAIKKDREGYDAAYKAFTVEQTKALDVINTKQPEDGLAAIQALEAWKPAA